VADDSENPVDGQVGGITRRQALKRGAVLGGALAWATPVVQVVGMRAAQAQTVSPGCQFELVPVNPLTGLPIPGATICLTYEQAVCDCIAAATSGAEIAVCLSAIPISVVLGPCS
jgi:hypothetical protein